MISKRLSKFIKSLKIKKFRVREKCFLVEGKKNVFELIESDYNLKYILITPTFLEENKQKLEDVNTILCEATPEELVELGTFTTNNDCLAVAEYKNYSISDIDPKDFLFALDGVGDPGNLGTIIRTLDWFGFKQILCSPDTAELYNPKVINSTMGSFTRVKVVYHDLSEFLNQSSYTCYGADMNGINIHEWKPENPSILIMGNESHGLRPETQKLLHKTVSIPKYGGAESLNVAMATGIFCHQLRS